MLIPGEIERLELMLTVGRLETEKEKYTQLVSIVKGRRYDGMVDTMGWYGRYHGRATQPASYRNQRLVHKTITSEHLQSRAATNLLGALVFPPSHVGPGP